MLKRVLRLFPASPRALRALRPQSLRLRLALLFSLLLLAAWLTAAAFALKESRDYIDEYFDTQMMLFARSLLSLNVDANPAPLPKTKKLLKGVKKKERGQLEDEALSFALFTGRGERLLTDGDTGRRLPFRDTRGFADTVPEDEDDPWRILWLASPDGARVAVVGQELEYRKAMALNLLSQQILPWLALIPVLLAGLLWMLGRELAPLRAVAATLERRPPQDTSPLSCKSLPSEVLPLVTALNSLFSRTAAMIARERAFIADAAHELRTPLTGLRVQAEVVTLSPDDAPARDHAVSQLIAGIDRCGHLVEQLLTLSRLDALAAPGLSDGSAPVAWADLIREALDAHRDRAAGKGLSLDCAIRGEPSVSGSEPLLAVLVRNLLDNAVNYTPPDGRIRVTLDSRELSIRNSGPGVDEALLPRLGERFFRPPGQSAAGSGLGLSIARAVAARHGFRLVLENSRPQAGAVPDGFVARLVFAPDARRN